MIPFVDLKAQYQSIKEEVNGAIQGVLDSCQFTLGSEVVAFEKEFAEYSGSVHGMGVNTGTSALHLALLAAGVGRGDDRHRQRDARRDAQADARQQVVRQRVAGEALEGGDEDQQDADHHEQRGVGERDVDAADTQLEQARDLELVHRIGGYLQHAVSSLDPL